MIKGSSSTCSRLLFDQHTFLHAAQFLKPACQTALKKLFADIDTPYEKTTRRSDYNGVPILDLLLAGKLDEKRIELNAGHKHDQRMGPQIVLGVLLEPSSSPAAPLVCGLTRDEVLAAANFLRLCRRAESSPDTAILNIKAKAVLSIITLVLWVAFLTLAVQLVQTRTRSLLSTAKLAPIFFILLSSIAIVSSISAILALRAPNCMTNGIRYGSTLMDLQENVIGLTKSKVLHKEVFVTHYKCFVKALGFKDIKNYENYIKSNLSDRIVGESGLDGEVKKDGDEQFYARAVVDRYKELQRFNDRCNSFNSPAKIIFASLVLGSIGFWVVSIVLRFAGGANLHSAAVSLAILSNVLDLMGTGGLLLVSVSYIVCFIALNKKREALNESINKVGEQFADPPHSCCITEGAEYSVYKSAATFKKPKTEFVKLVILTCGLATLLASKITCTLEATGDVLLPLKNGSFKLICCLLISAVLLISAHNLITTFLSKEERRKHAIPAAYSEDPSTTTGEVTVTQDVLQQDAGELQVS